MSRAFHLRTSGTALATVGLAGLSVAAIDALSLGSGGLLIPGVALLVAVFVGLPVARAEALAPRTGPLAIGAATLSETLVAVAIAAAAAPSVAQLGWVGAALAVAVWTLVGRLPAGATRWTAVVLGALALLGAGAASTWSFVDGPGFTLLQPWHQGWMSWLGLAVTMGLLWPLAGLGRLSADTPRVSVAALGAGALATLAVCLRLAATWESGTPMVVDPWMVALLAVWLPAALTASRATWKTPRTTTVVGLLATLFFAWPAAPALTVWWTVLLPVGIAASLLIRGLCARGLSRAVLFLGAVAALTAPAVSWPELPGPMAVALVALIPVMMVWLVGTRTLMARRA